MPRHTLPMRRQPRKLSQPSPSKKIFFFQQFCRRGCGGLTSDSKSPRVKAIAWPGGPTLTFTSFNGPVSSRIMLHLESQDLAAASTRVIWYRTYQPSPVVGSAQALGRADHSTLLTFRCTRPTRPSRTVWTKATLASLSLALTFFEERMPATLTDCTNYTTMLSRLPTRSPAWNLGFHSTTPPPSY